MKKKIIISIITLVAVMSSLLTGCGSKGGDTIKIGTILPVSGDIAAYGTQTRDAIQMAIEEINENGGVLGKDLELLTEDDEGNPEKTVNAFKKLVSKDEVDALIGALTSNCSLAINTEAQNEGIVMISPSSTNDTVTLAGEYIFRSCYSDSFQGQVVAKFANETLKASNAAILYDVTNDYSVGLMNQFKAKFESLGGTVVTEESYSKGDKDFKAQLTSIKGKNPDVLFIPDYYATVALIAKQVRNAGIEAPMVGSDGWDSITTQNVNEVEGSYYSNHYSAEVDDEQVKNFVQKYNDKYKVQPNALAALGYDAAYILAEAIERAGSVDSEKIKEEMFKTDYKGVTGQIKFDENGDTIKSAVMEQIVKEGDTLVTKYAGTVNP